MSITSYPGPDISIRMDDLNQGGVVARRYRNRRIGEFLKELRLTEGRGTGVPSIIKAMRDNGSPAPRFVTDEARTYFTTVLPIHPLALSLGDGEEGIAAGEEEVAPEVLEFLRAEPRRRAVLRATLTAQARSSLQAQLGLSDPDNFRRNYLHPLIRAGLVVPTVPGSPHAPNQRYVATDLGRAVLVELAGVADAAEKPGPRRRAR